MDYVRAERRQPITFEETIFQILYQTENKKDLTDNQGRAGVIKNQTKHKQSFISGAKPPKHYKLLTPIETEWPTRLLVHFDWQGWALWGGVTFTQRVAVFCLNICGIQKPLFRQGKSNCRLHESAIVTDQLLPLNSGMTEPLRKDVLHI